MTRLVTGSTSGKARSIRRGAIVILTYIAAFMAATLFTISAASAQSDVQRKKPLELSEVLASSAEHFPSILESLAKRTGAQGGALSALGAFDLVFDAEGKTYATGFYDGTVISGRASQNLRALGGTVYGGYKISDGSFPIYDDRNFTNTGGEVMLGALFSLLRDRAIDDRRFNIAMAELGIDEAELSLLMTRVGVQHRAQTAYWKWIAAGRQLAIYEDLFQIAKARQEGLEEQVRQGARAEIFLTENRQNITRRQILATEARRDYIKAANTLSLYYRDTEGSPIVPGQEHLPPPPAIDMDTASAAGILSNVTDMESAAGLALARRPELALIELSIERARNEVQLGRNERLPRLDLTYELLRDFGDIGEGGISRDSTDNVIGLKFSVPLQRRSADGKIQKAQADIEAAQQRRRLIQDQIEIEIRNIILDLDMAQQLTLLAVQEVEQSRRMEQAERQRFAGGASDFFLVNVREETASDAAIRFYLADLNARIARANFDAATVNLERLGLTSGGY